MDISKALHNLTALAFVTMFVSGCGSDTTTVTPIPSPPEVNENLAVFADGSEFIFEKDVRIQMRDGITLSANVFRPNSDGTYPVIMAMTPYNKDWLDVEYEESDGHINVSEFATFEQADPAFWVPNGYVVIAVDNRGMNLSEGDMAILNDQEAQDYYDAIEWAGVQAWSNGNVGLNGVSYMAMNQWKVAELAPPHLKAFMPWEGLTDLYRDFAYHGGIGGNSFLQGWWMFRILENKHPNAAEQNLFNQVQLTPFLDAFYEHHSPSNLSSINIPAYVVASWPDHGLHTRGTLAGFEQIQSPYKWLEIHGRKKWEWYYSDEAKLRQLSFFNHFLADNDKSIMEQPSVTYELRSAYYEGETKYAENWPLSLGYETVLYLNAINNQLSESMPSSPSKSEYNTDTDTDPDTVSESERVVFSHTFSNDTEITGGMKAVLWISLEGAQDTDIFVGIQKHDINGEVVHFFGNDIENGQVANGWLRASHREQDLNRSSFLTPYHLHQQAQPILEDDIVEVEIEILPSSTLFRAGERLSIVIQGTDIEESGLEHESISQGKVIIHTSEQYPSRLQLQQFF